MKEKKFFEELREGDIVVSRSSGLSYIVTANYGDRATAIRTADVTNPTEWMILRRDTTKQQEQKPDPGYPAANPTGHFL